MTIIVYILNVLVWFRLLFGVRFIETPCMVSEMSAFCLATQAKPMKSTGGQVCQICGDNVGKTADGEPFVACDVCAFPVCRPCYEYERKDGNQSCPQCKTRYKRLNGRLNSIVSLYALFNVRK
jgi:hypothetical protein